MTDVSSEHCSRAIALAEEIGQEITVLVQSFERNKIGVLAPSDLGLFAVTPRAARAFVTIRCGGSGGCNDVFELIESFQYFFGKFHTPLMIVKLSIVTKFSLR